MENAYHKLCTLDRLICYSLRYMHHVVFQWQWYVYITDSFHNALASCLTAGYIYTDEVAFGVWVYVLFLLR